MPRKRPLVGDERIIILIILFFKPKHTYKTLSLNAKLFYKIFSLFITSNKRLIKGINFQLISDNQFERLNDVRPKDGDYARRRKKEVILAIQKI